LQNELRYFTLKFLCHTIPIADVSAERQAKAKAGPETKAAEKLTVIENPRRVFLSQASRSITKMSGFEIAGVVLGSIPLIISALEHYAEGVSTPTVCTVRLEAYPNI
jgi:hypothetical protein